MVRAVVLLMLCTGLASAQAKKAATKISEVEQAVIDATNAERKAKKLEPLKMNPQLMDAARAHAANMAKQDKLAHELDGENVDKRAVKAGYRYRRIGENVAWNQKDAAQVLEGWMNSEGHRKNILNDQFAEIGVAAVANAKGEIYWVQVFGRSR